ncbi:MAG TPA: hypothetical protein VGJ57_11130 [Nitrospirales bacterium]|jgi:hypothetical protein
MNVRTVRLVLAVVMGIWIALVANHWHQWMPDSVVLIAAAALSFVVAIGLAAYRMKFLEENFGVLEIPEIWQGELVQAISWDVVAYTSIFSALILGGILAAAVSVRLPLTFVPLAYILSIAVVAIARWMASALLLRMIR